MIKLKAEEHYFGFYCYPTNRASVKSETVLLNKTNNSNPKIHEYCYNYVGKQHQR